MQDLACALVSPFSCTLKFRYVANFPAQKGTNMGLALLGAVVILINMQPTFLANLFCP